MRLPSCERERWLPPARGRDPLRRRSPAAHDERGHRRGRLQHRDDRLPGVGHRSLLRGPDHRLHLPADRQLRRLARRRWSPTASTPAASSCATPRTARTSPPPRAAGSTGSPTAACRGSAASTPAPWSATSATAARCAAASSRPRLPEAEARERIAAEPSMDGADLARTVTPPEPVRFEGDGPHVVGIDTGVKLNIVRQLRERGCRLTLLPCTSHRRGGAGRGPRRRLPRQRPRRSRPRSATSSTPSASWSASGRSSASASATSCSAARSASRPTSCPSATAAPTTRSRTWRRGGSTSPRRTTASPSQGPGGEPRIEGDEPVRWETDFGVAELSHLNLYDRTVEGLVLRDVAGATVQYHPEAGPGPHDARHLFDRFLELGRDA